jgi:anti-sigma B factor antagonist
MSTVTTLPTTTIPVTEHLKFEDFDGVTIVRFRDPRVTDPGEIEELGRQLYQALEHKSGSRLVIDLSTVAFLPSATIGKLISLNRKAKACKAALRLCGLQQGVRDIFHMCALDRVFEVRDDVRAAVASFE